MKAIILKHTGGIENLVKADIAMPVIKEDEVLVEVKSISINPVDAFVRGYEMALKNYLKPAEGEWPIIVGWDIAGVVTEAGKSVTDFKPGDAVFGLVNFPGHGKAYAGFAAAPANQLAKKPDNISFQEAAAATLAALTAWQALVTHAQVKAGEKVLIHSASGGVGHYAVQLAKKLGAFVIGTGSIENREFILELGADVFIDYKNEVFEDIIMDADVVLDSVAGNPEHICRSLAALKPGGRLISLLTFFDEDFKQKLAEKNVFGYRLGVSSNGQDMAEIAKLLEQGNLKSHVSEEFGFDDLPKAHAKIATAKTRGKIVVNV